MEEKANKIILKKDIEAVLEAINESKSSRSDFASIDIDKLGKFISSFEGCNVDTAVVAIATSLLLLPAGAIIAALSLGRVSLKTRTLQELAETMYAEHKKETPDSEAE